MNRWIIMILLMRSFMLCALEDLPQEYAVGKNVRLSLQERKMHLLKQARMIDQEVSEQLKNVLKKAQSSKRVNQDLKSRDCNLDRISMSWDDLEKHLKKRGLKDVMLFGFGSLVNKHANYQSDVNIPAVAFGIKRIYNMKHAHPEDSILGLPTCGYNHEQMRLNNKLTGKVDDMVNGILLKFTIGSEAYADLKEREKTYRLMPIKVALYRALLHNKIVLKDGYVLLSHQDKSSAHGDPHVVYNSLVLDGFKDIENHGLQGFVPLFLDTTYLSDEKTTIRDWIRKNSAQVVSD